MLRGPFVEGLGRHVEAVGPDDGPDLRVEAGLGEEVRIGEWLRDASPAAAGEVDVADEPVAEGDAELVIADDLGIPATQWSGICWLTTPWDAYLKRAQARLRPT